MPIQITSTRSPRVQAVRDLHDRAGRRAAGRFLIEGPHAVTQALDLGLVRELWVREGVACDPAWPIDILASPAVMQVIAQTQHPQGVIAVCDIPSMEVGQVLRRPGQVLVLDRLADPGNLGTLIRTAAAASAAGIILTAGSVDPCNDKVVRAAAGTWFALPIAEAGDGLADAIRGSGRMLIGLDAHASEDLYDLVHAGRIPPDAAWVIGSESHGLGGQIDPDLLVRIPMAAGVESLNAAVAGALCMYANRHAPANPGSFRNI